MRSAERRHLLAVMQWALGAHSCASLRKHPCSKTLDRPCALLPDGWAGVKTGWGDWPGVRQGGRMAEWGSWPTLSPNVSRIPGKQQTQKANNAQRLSVLQNDVHKCTDTNIVVRVTWSRLRKKFASLQGSWPTLTLNLPSIARQERIITAMCSTFQLWSTPHGHSATRFHLFSNSGQLIIKGDVLHNTSCFVNMSPGKHTSSYHDHDDKQINGGLIQR